MIGVNVHVAGYPPRPGGWVSEAQAASLKKAALVILQDLLPSPLSDSAKYLLPAGAWAEKDGTFVNHSGLAQAIRWGATPPGECRTYGQVFLDLQERRGLLHADTLRAEQYKRFRGETWLEELISAPALV